MTDTSAKLHLPRNGKGKEDSVKTRKSVHGTRMPPPIVFIVFLNIVKKLKSFEKNSLKKKDEQKSFFKYCEKITKL